MSAISFYAAQDYLYNKGLTVERGKEWLVRCMAEAFLNTTQICQGSGSIGQAIVINCNPTPIVGRVFPNNKSCQLCRKIKEEFIKGRNELEKQAQQRSGGKYVPQTLSGYVEQTWNSPSATDDPCRFVCENCIIEDQEQVAYLHMSETCQWSGAFEVAYETQLRNAIAVEVVEKRKELEQAGKDFDPGDVSINIVKEVKLKFWSDQFILVFQLVNDMQQIRIADNSSSVVAAGNIQRFSGRAILQFISRISAQTEFFDQTQVDQEVEKYGKFDTFGDLENDLKHVVSSLGDLVRTVVGKIMVIILGILIIVVLGLILTFSFRKKLMSM